MTIKELLQWQLPYKVSCAGYELESLLNEFHQQKRQTR